MIGSCASLRIPSRSAPSAKTFVWIWSSILFEPKRFGIENDRHCPLQIDRCRIRFHVRRPPVRRERMLDQDSTTPRGLTSPHVRIAVAGHPAGRDVDGEL